jgi:hypothetical protein
MKRIIEIDATHWKCPDCGAEHEEAFPWESGIQGQTAECAKCRVELMVTEPISPTPIQQVRDALELVLTDVEWRLDSPTKRVVKQALHTLQGKELVSIERVNRLFPPEIVDMWSYLREEKYSPTLSELTKDRGVPQGKVIVDKERLEKILKNVQCKIRWHECPMLHNGSCTRKETEESCIKRLKAYLAKEE